MLPFFFFFFFFLPSNGTCVSMCTLRMRICTVSMCEHLYISYVYVFVYVYVCGEIRKRVCTVLPTNGSRVELQQYREKKFDVELFYRKKRKKRKEKKKTRNNDFCFCAEKTITITVHRVEASNTRKRNFRHRNPTVIGDSRVKKMRHVHKPGYVALTFLVTFIFPPFFRSSSTYFLRITITRVYYT